MKEILDEHGFIFPTASRFHRSISTACRDRGLRVTFFSDAVRYGLVIWSGDKRRYILSNWGLISDDLFSLSDLEMPMSSRSVKQLTGEDIDA